MIPTENNFSLPQALDGGLTLRRSCAADADALAEFNSRIHEDALVGIWTRDLLSSGHPTFRPQDFLIAEEADSRKIVSASTLISQTWAYEGIPFKVGRPELVGTDPEYRKRGLVRKQFDVLHAWSRERGEMMQVITGIPFYYRQFGYEMALALGGGRTGFEPNVPLLPEGQAEPYHVRPARPEDLNFVAALYNEAGRRNVLHCLRDAAMWRYDLDGQSQGNVNRAVICVIEDSAGQLCGFLLHPPILWTDSLAVLMYELAPGVSWQAVTPSVLRYVWTTGQQLAAEAKSKCLKFHLQLGSEHPAYDVLREQTPEVNLTYAWYIRIPDLAGFMKQIAPALDARLAASACCGYSGELMVSFYRSGLRLGFEQGRLLRVEPYDGSWKDPHTAFPGLTFYQLLLGYRSLDELRYSFADCSVQKQHRALVEALFPKKATALWPVH